MLGVLALAAGCSYAGAPRHRPELENTVEATPRHHVYADFALGAGDYEHDTSGDGGFASGETDGGYLRVRGEYFFDLGLGTGISIEGIGSDDDLFADAGSPDVEGSSGVMFLYFVTETLHTDDF